MKSYIYKRHIERIAAVLVIAIVAGAVYFGIVRWYLDLPVVEVDAHSGQCVRVYSLDGTTTCQNMPRIYERVFVAPVIQRRF